MAKVITGKVRFSYAHVFEPSSITEDQEKKYSVCCIIPKSDTKTIEKIRKAIKEALEEGKAKLGGKIPTNYKNPLRDGDEERSDDPAFENSYFMNASSTRKPQIVDKDLNEIMDKEEFYSGCFGRASVNFYAFNTAGNKGVAAGLNNLQKMAEGERLAGGSTAENDFSDDYEDDDLM